MTKIYLAENFLEADQIISELEANHIFAKKHEIIETSITARMAKPVFEIYVDDKNIMAQLSRQKFDVFIMN